MAVLLTEISTMASALVVAVVVVHDTDVAVDHDVVEQSTPDPRMVGVGSLE